VKANRFDMADISSILSKVICCPATSAMARPSPDAPGPT
jgi:hypothetical protein